MDSSQPSCAGLGDTLPDTQVGAQGSDPPQGPEAAHKYDVFIFHGDSDFSLAQEILRTIEANEFSCVFGEGDVMPGSYESDVIAEAVKSARRVVVLLSRDLLKTEWKTLELLTSTCETYDKQMALIVPVLVDITEAEVPPCLRNVSLVDMRRDPNYQHKLMTILKAPEVTVRELMPAGNVSHGLAWCYYLNYLRFILADMARRIDKWCDPQRKNSQCKDVRMPRKLYILVPASCFCPAKLDSSGHSGDIRFGGHLEDIIRTTGGSVDRVYKHTVWNIHRENGEVLQFVGEYCNVLHTLYLMECEHGSGLDAQQLQVQKDQFLGILQNLLKCYGHESQAKVVVFRDVNTTCRKDPGFIAPKGNNCAQYYNCSNPRGALGPYVSECPIGQLFDAATGLCAPRHMVRCKGRPAPRQACHYRLQQCPFAKTGSSCSPCQERFPSCWGKPNGPVPLPRQLSARYVRCHYGQVTGVYSCRSGQFLDPKYRRCTAELTMNTTMHFCMNHPNTLSSHPLHCARYILCKNLGTPPPTEGECPYPNLFSGGRCLGFRDVDCGTRYEPKAPCEYASIRECRDKTQSSCALCQDRFPSCEGLPGGNRPYPGRMFTPWFVKCNTERTLAVVRCVNSLFDPVTKKCGHTLDQILDGVAKAPAQFCRQYPQAVAADPLHCARFYNCSRAYPGLIGRPFLSECRFPSLFNRRSMQCDSFINVIRNVGCGRSKQPLHQCEYSSYCPGTRYRTCRDCYNHIPNCRGIRDGIHTIPPGRRVSKAFVYCLDQRALVYSQCPNGFIYYDAAKTCVMRTSGMLPPYILATVTEPPEV